MPEYSPSTDYAAADAAIRRRIAQNFAGQRANLNQELATRGVSTSGVAAIPSSRLRAAEAGEMDNATSTLALEQARTAVEDRQAATNFERNKELARLGFDLQSSLQRRLGQDQLKAALIGGTIGLGGSLARGPR